MATVYLHLEIKMAYVHWSGKRKSSTGVDFMVASETIALDALGYKRCDDVAPGEAIFIDLAGNLHRSQCAPKQKKGHVFLNLFIWQELTLWLKISLCIIPALIWGSG